MSKDRLKSLCASQGLTIAGMLSEAGVSRNAFYTLARKESVLPGSVRAIARRLNVKPSAFLGDDNDATGQARLLADKVDRIAKRYCRIDRDNVRHALLLLEEEPLTRLRRALTRGTNKGHTPSTEGQANGQAL